MDGGNNHPYTLRGTGRFAISRLQGSEAEQTKRGHLEHQLRLLCTAALRAGTAPLEPPPVSPAHGPLPWPTADQGLRRLGNPRSNPGLESPHRGPGAWLPVHETVTLKWGTDNNTVAYQGVGESFSTGRALTFSGVLGWSSVETLILSVLTGQFLAYTEYPYMANDPNANNAHESFLRLFTRFEGNLRAFVTSLLPTTEGVDDVMQEASVVLWRKFAEFDASGEEMEFLSWAFMIARYEVLKYRRGRATDRLQFSEDVMKLLADDAIQVCTNQIDRQLALHECVKRLESKQQALVKAVYEDGVAIKDVAKQIGRTPTGLYKALARIRDRLTKCVNKMLVANPEGLS